METNIEKMDTMVVRFSRPLLLTSGFEERDYKLLWGFTVPARQAYPEDIDSYIGYLALTHLHMDGVCHLIPIINTCGSHFYLDNEGTINWSCSIGLKAAQDAVRQLGLTYYMYGVENEVLDCLNDDCYMEQSWIINRNFFSELEDIINYNIKERLHSKEEDDLPF